MYTSPKTMNTGFAVICLRLYEVLDTNAAHENLSTTPVVVCYGVHEVLDINTAPQTMSTTRAFKGCVDILHLTDPLTYHCRAYTHGVRGYVDILHLIPLT